MSVMKRPSAEPVNRAARCYLRFAGARRPQLDFFTISDCAASAVCGASELLRAPPRFVVHQKISRSAANQWSSAAPCAQPLPTQIS